MRMSRDGACCGAMAMLVDGDLYQFVPFFYALKNPMGQFAQINEGPQPKGRVKLMVAENMGRQISSK